MNCTLPHQTYLDYLLSGNHVDMWEKHYKSIRNRMSSMTWNNTVYQTLHWNGREYVSAQEQASSITLEWIVKNPKMIAYCRGYGDCVYYFIVRGYVMTSIHGFDYPLALCTPIKVKSLMEDFFTFCAVEVDPCWKEDLNECYCISLYRLYIGQAIAYKYTNDVVGLSPMALHIDQFREECGDPLFSELKKQISSYYKDFTFY